ncbi:MAG TPA: SRPBCC family protein [Dehalococcoidia bacterium]
MTTSRTSSPEARAELGRTSNLNVGTVERWLSAFAGGALIAYGAARRDKAGVALALAGGGVAWRGVSGRSSLNAALGRNSAATHAGPNASVKHREGMRVEHSVTIDRPADELYRFWRNLENLPRFMRHLESVEVIDDRRSRWTAKAPAGRSVSWEAEIVSERPPQLIGWRSLEGSEIAHAGSVHFIPAPGGRGTQVRVEIEYHAPGGRAAAAIARLFGEEPAIQVREDLRRLKQLLEAGEVATNALRPPQAPDRAPVDQPESRWPSPTAPRTERAAQPAASAGEALR